MSTNDPLLRRTDVERRTHLSRASIYRLMRQGAFPEPIRLGGRTVRWRLSEIENWLASRPRATGREDRAAA